MALIPFPIPAPQTPDSGPAFFSPRAQRRWSLFLALMVMVVAFCSTVSVLRPPLPPSGIWFEQTQVLPDVPNLCPGSVLRYTVTADVSATAYDWQPGVPIVFTVRRFWFNVDTDSPVTDDRTGDPLLPITQPLPMLHPGPHIHRRSFVVPDLPAGPQYALVVSANEGAATNRGYSVYFRILPPGQCGVRTVR